VSPARRAVSALLGLALAAALLKLAACSGLDPNPPYPGAQSADGDAPDLRAHADASDASEEPP